MNKPLKVSIIIPCYNVGKYIRDCFKSIESQTYKTIELILVDDGSSDDTLEIIENLKAQSTLSIKIITQSNNGASSARNNGLRYAGGDYIQFLDADDLLLPNKIEQQIKLVEQTNYPEMVIGSYRRQNMKNELLYERVYKTEEIKDVWLNLMNTDLGNTCANLFKSECFKNGISWKENLKSSQEYNLMFQILKKYKNIIFDSALNTVIRVRESGSISQINLDKKWERYVDLRVAIVDYLKREHPEILNNEIYQALFTCIRMLYPYNASKAISNFKTYLPEGFVPKESNAIGSKYLFFYKLIGFKNTENLISMLRKNKAQ